MLSHEENELLTRTGPGTPMGQLMRRYWIPAVFSAQIAGPDSPPVRVQLLGENLVAFRDTEGRVGLLDERCPHRTASLFFGRNEECGLRCVYHGWKFDVEGNCVDLPSEPPGSSFQDKIRVKAYPSIERAGLVWTYMGPSGLMPEFPELEWTLLPENQRLVSRHIQECNWLQGLEGGFDASHIAFLHRGTGAVNQHVVPSFHETMRSDFGAIVGTGRESGEGDIRWGTALFIAPFQKVFASNPNGAHIWVPMDDENTMLYSVDFYPAGPADSALMKRSREYFHIHTENLPGTDHAIQNKGNDYLIDRAVQAGGQSYTGLKGLGVQDCAIQESMGPIADRTIEHLGVSDQCIIQLRQLLLEALNDHEQGKTPPGLDPKSYRARSIRFHLPPGESFEAAMRENLRNMLTPSAAE